MILFSFQHILQEYLLFQSQRLVNLGADLTKQIIVLHNRNQYQLQILAYRFIRTQFCFHISWGVILLFILLFKYRVS